MLVFQLLLACVAGGIFGTRGKLTSGKAARIENGKGAEKYRLH